VADLVITGAALGDGLDELLVSGGRIAQIADRVTAPVGCEVFDAGGGAVLPGLHDHHIHLAAAAAALDSVEVGPPAVVDRAQLAHVLDASGRHLPEGAWLRGVGYHESVAGPIGRRDLDLLVKDRPVRLQHRSGAQWVLNTRALEELAVADTNDAGVERDPSGAPTGRLFRMDRWLGERIERPTLPLARVGDAAARAGVTGFTDATPADSPEQLRLLAAAGLPQRITAMTAFGAPVDCPAPLSLGPIKVLLDDVALPTLDELTRLVADAHAQRRSVAIHCVTRVQTILAVAALEVAGARSGDRIEHGSVIPGELIPRLRALGVTVVTNPGFIEARGDRYALDVEDADQGDLYRCASLGEAGVPVAAGTDAPFGPADPWVSIRAAATRRTASGGTLGERERLDPRAALSLFLGSAEDPATPRRLRVGSRADLCILFLPLRDALRSPSAEHVAATLVGGALVADNR
jgi:predicted amidohydrolase YtcJ